MTVSNQNFKFSTIQSKSSKTKKHCDIKVAQKKRIQIWKQNL